MNEDGPTIVDRVDAGLRKRTAECAAAVCAWCAQGLTLTPPSPAAELERQRKSKVKGAGYGYPNGYAIYTHPHPKIPHRVLFCAADAVWQKFPPA